MSFSYLSFLYSNVFQNFFAFFSSDQSSSPMDNVPSFCLGVTQDFYDSSDNQPPSVDTTMEPTNHPQNETIDADLPEESETMKVKGSTSKSLCRKSNSKKKKKLNPHLTYPLCLR